MRRQLFAFTMALLFTGCLSSGGKGGGEGLDRQSAPLTQDTTQNSGVDLARPYFVQAQPGARCIFRHAGDTSGGDVIRGDENGRVYFFPPPRSSGPNLDVECTGGSARQQISINLDDASTFQVDSDIAQQPKTSIRPPLTGNLDAIPAVEILRRGYPPRPDAKRSPERYRRWVDIVSSPRPVIGSKMITMLGRKASNYAGTYTMVENSGQNAWAGRALDVNGWTPTSDPMYSDFPVQPNENDGSSFYYQYDTYIYVPPQNVSRAGSDSYAYIWAGMGGMEDRAGIKDGSLIQSGIYLQTVSGVPSISLFTEFFPGQIHTGLTNPGINPMDWIDAWAWTASDSSCSDYSSSWTPQACFGFYNMTTNAYSAFYTEDFPDPAMWGNRLYYGWTFESIVENLRNFDFPDFQDTSFNEFAHSWDGNGHDPTSDPWIYIDSSTTSASDLIAYHYGTTDDPTYYDVYWRWWSQGSHMPLH
jgi:hypothetical protein